MKSTGHPDARAELRRRAEERLRAQARHATRIKATQDVVRLIHELQVHQIELELQNEELRRARDELEASAARYSELYDFAPVGYATLDGRSAILELNFVASAMLGATRAHLVGQRLASFVTPTTRPALEGLLAALHGEARGSCDLTLAGDKGPLYVRVDGVPDSATGSGEWRCRVALTDVTEHRTAAELRESDRRRSDFLAVLSHELRNPLAPIANAIHVLEAAPAGSEQALRARAVIERQTRHLSRLVDDLLDLTRISKGRIELKLELVDLGELVRRSYDDHRAVFEARGIELRASAPDRPLLVRGDPTRLTQVVGNLLHNAAKFTPAGGTTCVTADAVQGRAEVRVRDSGRGIEPGRVAALFEPFAQGDDGLARPHGGLGLGLSLLKGLVELHGGTVRGTSGGIGCGSEFVVSLPLETHPVVHAAPTPSRPPPRSIVIIEDNADSAFTLADVLELAGHEVKIALDGRSGVDLVRGARPDFVLCDIGLPDVDGYEVAATLRRDEALRATRLVALSGYARPEDRERARAAGFDAHLPKPADLDALNALLARHA